MYLVRKERVECFVIEVNHLNWFSSHQLLLSYVHYRNAPIKVSKDISCSKVCCRKKLLANRYNECRLHSTLNHILYHCVVFFIASLFIQDYSSLLIHISYVIKAINRTINIEQCVSSLCHTVWLLAFCLSYLCRSRSTHIFYTDVLSFSFFFNVRKQRNTPEPSQRVALLSAVPLTQSRAQPLHLETEIYTRHKCIHLSEWHTGAQPDKHLHCLLALCREATCLGDKHE